jgi:hypothetical protein
MKQLQQSCNRAATELERLNLLLMQVKIKGLVDIITGAALEASPGASMLHDRLHALQKIVNASVYAMRTDDHANGNDSLSAAD